MGNQENVYSLEEHKKKRFKPVKISVWVTLLLTLWIKKTYKTEKKGKPVWQEKRWMYQDNTSFDKHLKIGWLLQHCKTDNVLKIKALA